MEKLIIPGKLKVGYQNRQDTYTQKLAYVIYYDPKGKLRKETSWLGWCSKDIPTDEFENVPTDGFIINRNVGGVRYSSWNWNQRREKVRVFDPRNFEFEITIENLLYILQECTSTKGKGLEGKFVYAWDGPELVLLPVDSEEYKKSTAFTGLQTMKVTKDTMVPGRLYKMKDDSVLMYLGRHMYYNWTWKSEKIEDDYGRMRKQWNTYHTNGKQMHIFVNPNDELKLNESWGNPFIAESGFTKVAQCLGPDIDERFADILVAYKESDFGCPTTGIVAEPHVCKLKTEANHWQREDYEMITLIDGIYYRWYAYQEVKDNYVYSYGQNTVQPDPRYTLLNKFTAYLQNAYTIVDGHVIKIDNSSPEYNLNELFYKVIYGSTFRMEKKSSSYRAKPEAVGHFNMDKFNELNATNCMIHFTLENGKVANKIRI